MYREGEFLYPDEYAAYSHFRSIASPSTWGTVTFEEWKSSVRYIGQGICWSDWVKEHRAAK